METRTKLIQNTLTPSNHMFLPSLLPRDNPETNQYPRKSLAENPQPNWKIGGDPESVKMYPKKDK